MHSCTFIIIDDDKLSNKIHHAIIKKTCNDYNVICYSDPYEGLKYIASDLSIHHKDEKVILLLDIHMPMIDAWDFIEKAMAMNKQVFDNLTVYVLSASIHPKDMARSEENKVVVTYLQKPLNSATVLSIANS